MTNSKVKNTINLEFGFQKSMITLLETGTDARGNNLDYVMFEVCGIEYQMRFDYAKSRYMLKIYDGHGYIEE